MCPTLWSSLWLPQTIMLQVVVRTQGQGQARVGREGSAAQLLKVWKWLASKCVTEVDVNVAQGLYIHWSTVKHSAEKLQAASRKLVEGSRRVCSRRLWNIHGVTRTQSQTGLASLARLHNNINMGQQARRQQPAGRGCPGETPHKEPGASACAASLPGAGVRFTCMVCRFKTRHNSRGAVVPCRGCCRLPATYARNTVLLGAAMYGAALTQQVLYMCRLF